MNIIQLFSLIIIKKLNFKIPTEYIDCTIFKTKVDYQICWLTLKNVVLKKNCYQILMKKNAIVIKHFICYLLKLLPKYKAKLKNVLVL